MDAVKSQFEELVRRNKDAMARSYGLAQSRFCGCCGECGGEPLWSPFFEKRLRSETERKAWREWRALLVQTQMERFQAWELAQRRNSQSSGSASSLAPTNAGPIGASPDRTTLETTSENSSDALEREDFESFASRTASVSASWHSTEVSRWRSSPPLSDDASVRSPRNPQDDQSGEDVSSQDAFGNQETEAESSMEARSSRDHQRWYQQESVRCWNQSIDAPLEANNTRYETSWELESPLQQRENVSGAGTQTEWSPDEPNAGAGGGAGAGARRSQPTRQEPGKPLPETDRQATGPSDGLGPGIGRETLVHHATEAIPPESSTTTFANKTTLLPEGDSLRAHSRELGQASDSIEPGRVPAREQPPETGRGIDTAAMHAVLREPSREATTLMRRESAHQRRSSLETAPQIDASVVVPGQDARPTNAIATAHSSSSLDMAQTRVPVTNSIAEPCPSAAILERDIAQLERRQHECHQQLESLQRQIATWQARLRLHLSERRMKLWKQLDMLRSTCAYLGYESSRLRRDSALDQSTTRGVVHRPEAGSTACCTLCTAYRQRIRVLCNDLAVLGVHLHIHESTLLRLRTGTYMSSPYPAMQRELEALRMTLKHLQHGSEPGPQTTTTWPTK